jgi:hypothetical protein
MVAPPEVLADMHDNAIVPPARPTRKTLVARCLGERIQNYAIEFPFILMNEIDGAATAGQSQPPSQARKVG